TVDILAGATAAARRRGALDAVLFERALALLREIDQLRRGRLHAEGEFVGGDAAVDLRVADLGVARAVQVAQRLDRLFLHGVGEAVGVAEVQDRVALAAEQDAGIARRQIAAQCTRRPTRRAAPGGEDD